MAEAAELIKHVLIKEQEQGKYLPLFLLVLFYLWARKAGDRILLAYCLLAVFFVGNPVFVAVIQKIIPGFSNYWELLWILPIVPVIAYGAVQIIYEYKSTRKRIQVFFAITLIIVLSGSMLPYHAYGITKVKYQNNEPFGALEAIASQVAYFDGKVVLLASDEIMKEARRYSSSIYPLYGKDLFLQDCNTEIADDYPKAYYELHEIMKEDYKDPELAADLAKKYGCNVVALREKIPLQTGAAEWELAEVVPGYYIYRILKESKL